MLRSNEYEAIKIDYDRVSRKHFEADYVAPPDMSFAKSEAMFPKGNIETALAAEFEKQKQCRILCFGEFPTCVATKWGKIGEQRQLSFEETDCYRYLSIRCISPILFLCC